MFTIEASIVPRLTYLHVNWLGIAMTYLRVILLDIFNLQKPRCFVFQSSGIRIALTLIGSICNSFRKLQVQMHYKKTKSDWKKESRVKILANTVWIKRARSKERRSVDFYFLGIPEWEILASTVVEENSTEWEEICGFLFLGICLKLIKPSHWEWRRCGVCWEHGCSFIWYTGGVATVYYWKCILCLAWKA